MKILLESIQASLIVLICSIPTWLILAVQTELQYLIAFTYVCKELLTAVSADATFTELGIEYFTIPAHV